MRSCAVRARRRSRVNNLLLHAMRPPGHVDETQDTPRTVGAAHRSAARAWGARPVPFRTRKLSPIAPRVLRGKPVGGQGAADRWTARAVHRELGRGALRGPSFLRRGAVPFPGGPWAGVPPPAVPGFFPPCPHPGRPGPSRLRAAARLGRAGSAMAGGDGISSTFSSRTFPSPHSPFLRSSILGAVPCTVSRTSVLTRSGILLSVWVSVTCGVALCATVLCSSLFQPEFSFLICFCFLFLCFENWEAFLFTVLHSGLAILYVPIILLSDGEVSLLIREVGTRLHCCAYHAMYLGFLSMKLSEGTSSIRGLGRSRRRSLQFLIR